MGGGGGDENTLAMTLTEGNSLGLRLSYLATSWRGEEETPDRAARGFLVERRRHLKFILLQEYH